MLELGVQSGSILAIVDGRHRQHRRHADNHQKNGHDEDDVHVDNLRLGVKAL